MAYDSKKHDLGHENHDHHKHEKDKHHDHHEHKNGGHEDHDKHAGHNVQDFRKRFIVSLIFTFPILALSTMIQEWMGFEWTFTGDRYVLATLSTFVFFYGGHPFLKGLYDEVRTNAIGMMTLIGIAISVAWAYSFAITFGLPGMDFYWEMATLIVIMNIGHYYEMKSVMGASRSLELLVKMMPSTAHLVKDDTTEEVEVSQIQKDDIVLVKPGEKVPVDGFVIEGESYVDESMLTGESKPVKKEKDSKAIGGSINSNGSLTIRVESTGKDSYLNKVVKLVEDAQKIKSRTQNFADRAAKVLTFVALFGGAITLTVWLSFPLAAGVLFAYGILLTPAVGAVLMSLSTIIVAINAQLLKRSMG